MSRHRNKPIREIRGGDPRDDEHPRRSNPDLRGATGDTRWLVEEIERVDAASNGLDPMLVVLICRLVESITDDATVKVAIEIRDLEAKVLLGDMNAFIALPDAREQHTREVAAAIRNNCSAAIYRISKLSLTPATRASWLGQLGGAWANAYVSELELRSEGMMFDAQAAVHRKYVKRDIRKTIELLGLASLYQGAEFGASGRACALHVLRQRLAAIS